MRAVNAGEVRLDGRLKASLLDVLWDGQKDVRTLVMLQLLHTSISALRGH